MALFKLFRQGKMTLHDNPAARQKTQAAGSSLAAAKSPTPEPEPKPKPKPKSSGLSLTPMDDDGN
ncbi:MAG: hypothetical protein ACI9HY_000796 [Planctomycetaceae bacterium]|jgi:hypothetical protein